MDAKTEQLMDKITKARRLLLKDYPEFGMTALNLKIVIDEECEFGGWTDGVSIGFSPTWVTDSKLGHVKSLWAHEALHVMLLHPFRKGERDHRTYNEAGDYVIDNIIVEAKLDAIPGWLYNRSYQDKTTEEVYDILIKNKTNPQPQNGTGKGRGRGGQGVTTPGFGPKVIGEVRQYPGNATEQKKQENTQKIRNTISIQTGKMWGNLPGSLLRQLGQIMEPKVSWQEVLRSYMDKLIRDDYSWRRLDPQYMQQDLLVPTLYGESMNELVVVTDSSGSISNENLAQFNAEFNACLAELPNTTVHVMDCDTKVYNTKEYHSKDDDIKLEVKGGGGTDFRPPFAKVEEMGLTPTLLIYLTDMECNAFPKEPDYPVLWVKVRNSTYAQNPPFGDVIDISE